jgi:predicted RNA binding protein YcfA (HicA-like mRNA interferase family)
MHPREAIESPRITDKSQRRHQAFGQEGWSLARTKGSHRQYHHPAKPGTVTVAGHPSVDIPPGTLNNILKQVGLK